MRLALLSLLALGPPAMAQLGDREGEEQPPLPADLVIPPAPVLTPEEALESFALAPGFAIELIAGEPLVEDPVQAVFDEDGRLWVVEMRGFMPNIDGKGEDAPIGVIAVLTDTDGDGRMDQRRVFMDQLVLPRTVQPTRGGALVLTPPGLYFCRDTDGDGRADERTEIATGLGGIHSPEHATNGLLYTHDNAFRPANRGVQWRFVDGEWNSEPTAGGGQWGITKDDVGRVFYNTNPDPLRGDLFPSGYAVRNPSFGTAWGVNVRIAHDMQTWPGRITPGVNRGYRPETLRDDFTLAAFTGACGPHIYRGDLFPDDYRGNAFVCEPTGNFVKRFVMRPKGGIELEAINAWEGREFLTSTDERFRPVNLFGGPDGALYVVDLYRGFLQHRIFVTSFLRKQVLERGLDKPVGLGRIWRVAPVDSTRRVATQLTDASWTELAALLSSPNGWTRDTAQRLIVEEGEDDGDALDLLREALESEEPLGRLHAVHALGGIDGFTEELIVRVLADPDPRVQVAAVRYAEPWFAAKSEPVFKALRPLIKSTDARVLHQLALSLGEGGDGPPLWCLSHLVLGNVESKAIRHAALSGMTGKEGALLALVLAPENDQESAGLRALLHDLARCVVRDGRGRPIAELLAHVSTEKQPWRQKALVDGLLAGRRKGPQGEPMPIRIDRELPSLPARLSAALVWPGKPGVEPAAEVRALDPDELALFRAGSETYATLCSTCHGPSGAGEPGKGPPLRYSEWVLGSEERLVRILLQGLDGPLKIDGEIWNAEMPAYVARDREVASILTYIRREWGHGADPIDEATVTRIRAASMTRSRPWTVDELLRVAD